MDRIVRQSRLPCSGERHVSQDIRKWMGDSIGWWEGDTLVVDTTNFNDTPGFGRATRDLHVVERFTRTDENSLMYSFTVDDPNTWDEPFSGEYPWPTADQPVIVAGGAGGAVKPGYYVEAAKPPPNIQDRSSPQQGRLLKDFAIALLGKNPTGWPNNNQPGNWLT